MTASKARSRSFLLIATLLLGVLAAVPVRASTESDLAAAKKRAAQVQAELDRASATFAAAETRYTRTLDRIEATRRDMARTRASLVRIRASLVRRARDAYQRGAGGNLEILLSSASFSQFSDRVEFLNRLSQGDSDLIVRAQVTQEQLRRQEGSLRSLSHEQASVAAELRAQQAIIDTKFREIEALVKKYGDQLEAQRRASQFVTIVRGSALQACPVAGPRSYSDDFGAPRPGGRTHQGNDIFAPLGTPVVAAQTGRFEQNYNSLGGTSALVYSDSGDYTYYAHLSSYAGVGNGSHVSAGTLIGHVGNSGDAAGGPYHLHFEYHPGGGSAVDPYPYLKAVCG